MKDENTSKKNSDNSKKSGMKLVDILKGNIRDKDDQELIKDENDGEYIEELKKSDLLNLVSVGLQTPMNMQ